MKETLKKSVKFWKSFWWKLVAFATVGSIVALFIASFCLKEELTLSVMNEWVSLILGMAAFILGIISLILSFYNVDQSYEVQKDTIDIMHKVQDDIENKLAELRVDMNKQFTDIRTGVYRGAKDMAEDVQTSMNIKGWEKWDE